MASPAPACKKALAQLTSLFPSRKRGADGIMGDAAHKKRPSDHNDGNAWDWTRDDALFDSWKLATGLISDPRVNYVIHRRRIWSRLRPYWRAYLGVSPHTAHGHVSILATRRADTSDWPAITALKPAPAVTPPPVTPPVVTPAPVNRGTVVNCSHVNLRARVMGKVLHVLSKGDVVTVTGSTMGWYKVSAYGHSGVVAAKYIHKG
jgi:hypothetical protein